MSFIREHIVKRLTRSSGWSKVRKAYVKNNPFCAACGTTRKLEVHHIKDFSTHPELELDPENLVTLCRAGTQCHLTFGHLGSWKSINSEVKKDTEWFIKKVKTRR
jgi:5-methylcytosine-specific restriction protein A